MIGSWLWRYSIPCVDLDVNHIVPLNHIRVRLSLSILEIVTDSRHRMRERERERERGTDLGCIETHLHSDLERKMLVGIVQQVIQAA